MRSCRQQESACRQRKATTFREFHLWGPPWRNCQPAEAPLRLKASSPPKSCRRRTVAILRRAGPRLLQRVEQLPTRSVPLERNWKRLKTFLKERLPRWAAEKSWRPLLGERWLAHLTEFAPRRLFQRKGSPWPTWPTCPQHWPSSGAVLRGSSDPWLGERQPPEYLRIAPSATKRCPGARAYRSIYWDYENRRWMAYQDRAGIYLQAHWQHWRERRSWQALLGGSLDL
jgi:hypothetical protein